MAMAIAAASDGKDGRWQGRARSGRQLWHSGFAKSAGGQTEARREGKGERAAVALRSTQTRRDGKMGRSCLALDEARRGVLLRRARSMQKLTLRAEVSRWGKITRRTCQDTAGDRLRGVVCDKKPVSEMIKFY